MKSKKPMQEDPSDQPDDSNEMAIPPPAMEGETIKIPDNFGQTAPASDKKTGSKKTFRIMRENSRK